MIENKIILLEILLEIAIAMQKQGKSDDKNNENIICLKNFWFEIAMIMEIWC